MLVDPLQRPGEARRRRQYEDRAEDGDAAAQVLPGRRVTSAMDCPTSAGANAITAISKGNNAMKA
jgi:hypothetical protein